MTRIIYWLLIFVFIKSGTCVYRYYMDTMCGHTFNFTTLSHEMMRLKLTQSATYRANMNCVLTLTAGLAQHFTVTVESMVTHDCRDNLKIMDGDLTSALIPGALLCNGAVAGTIFRSFGSKLSLKFVSVYSINSFAGFSLHIEAFLGEPDATGYMEYSCGQTIDFDTLNLNSFHLRLTPNAANNHSLNCSLLFTTKPSDNFDIHVTNTDIENCTHCSCDWLDIRDGNSRLSPYVAGANVLESTTSTVIPTTKPYVATSAAPLHKVQETISVNCNENTWIIGVNMDRLRKIYPDAKASDIYLGENRCTGIELAGVLLFQQSLEECLSGSSSHNGVNTFTNELIYAEHDPQHSFIIRHYKWTIGVQCDLLPNRTVSGSFYNQLTTPQSISTSQHQVNVSFFLDPNFTKAISGNPLRAATGTNIYVKVFTTTANWNTVMKVQSCYTMPSPNATADMKFSLIKNGCEMDTNTHIISQSTHETRFVFEDFEYANSHDGLYLYCDAMFCASSDWSTSCRQTCAPVVRRSIKWEGTDS
ncbi:deleted in malignant brain tumors 1 protein-like isoform X2 [Mercenaria mercenaria]|uniref:deleted in malignant brain tumors 1 protein-like isoform X2 n=1 Tax=Mercenaria mercenaria TaxID=6596 RepID=UPI00234F80BC|nr:deleted in malignant brain tumors 1 protein-like isoform X2 [Mercenaria mercenaria]